EGASYIDKLQAGAQCRQQGPVRFSGEVDRVDFDTTADVQLLDGSGEPLWVQRRNSQAVVVWNPWQAKGARLYQFPADGYRGMVCIEAAEAGPDARLGEAGQTHWLQTIISRHSPYVLVRYPQHLLLNDVTRPAKEAFTLLAWSH